MDLFTDTLNNIDNDIEIEENNRNNNNDSFIDLQEIPLNDTSNNHENERQEFCEKIMIFTCCSFISISLGIMSYVIHELTTKH